MEIVMTVHMPFPATSALTRIAVVARVAALRLADVVRAYRHRRDMHVLASFDDRMLRDIGLTRGDLRDATAEPVWRDPTAVLVTRARERRTYRRRLWTHTGTSDSVEAPPTVPAIDELSSRLMPARSRYY
jgi:uncharacterized protein YjiS (DUF1127 family)